MNQAKSTPCIGESKSLLPSCKSNTATAIGPVKSLSVEEQRRVAQRKMFEGMQETKKKYPSKKIPADIDINNMIDEMHWEGNH